MATTKSSKKPVKNKNGVPEPGEVLTLAEAAAFLRASEENVVRLVNEQELPGRFVADGWRFLKSALKEWLARPMPKPACFCE